MPLITEPNETYHAHPAWSKSKLWRYAQYTPYRANKETTTEKDYFLFGRVGHTAILEPELLESVVVEGPDVSGTTKAWQEAKKKANDDGKDILKPKDYKMIMDCRDIAMRHPIVQMMMKGKTFIETSCYAVDPETGAEVRVRPDLYNADICGMMDIKFLKDIEDDTWSADLGRYGYPTQQAMYEDVWNIGSGYKSEFMVFPCISKGDVPEIVVREIEPIDVEEGMARYREALAIAEKCRREQHWPGKPLDVVRGVKMRDRDRKFTPSQWNVKEDEDETNI